MWPNEHIQLINLKQENDEIRHAAADQRRALYVVSSVELRLRQAFASDTMQTIVTDQVTFPCLLVLHLALFGMTAVQADGSCSSDWVSQHREVDESCQHG